MPPEIIKAYNILDVGENDAEINMYGEVVDTRPIDFWTGEPVGGNFIMLDEFLRDLDGLKSKSNITIHINSVGGDLYGGISIYNRLKALPANITTINDGLAASAGSIIFQAGNTRRMNAGSNLMIHQAAGFLYGYYQSGDLKGVIKQLDAGNKAAVAVYAEASGRESAELKAMLDRETWLTGQEAVDAGLADEVIDTGVQVSMSLAADKSFLEVNGVRMSTRGMHNIPAGLPVIPAVAKANVSAPAPAPVEDKSKTERETETVDIKNVDELRAAFPELTAQVETAARAEGIAAERSRLQAIESIQGAIDPALVAEAKYGAQPMDAAGLALRAMQAQAALGAQTLNNMQADATASGAAAVGAAANGGPEAKGMEPYDAAKEIADAVNTYKMMMGGKNNG